MRRVRVATGLGGAVAILLTALAAPPATAGDTSSSGAVRIGVARTFFRDTPESLIPVVSRPLKSLVESQTGTSGQIVLGNDAQALGQQLHDGKVQLAVFHGIEFAWAKQKCPDLKPLVLAVCHKPRLRACLVVAKDCQAAGFGDLRGKVLALPRPPREHCLLFAERRCLQCGGPMKQVFKEVKAPTDPEDALDAVVNKVADAAVVDSVALEMYQKAKPGRGARLRVALESEIFPAAVVAYCPGKLSEEVAQRFRDGLLGANRTAKGQQLLSMCRITAFAQVTDDYGNQLKDIARAYPPPAALQTVQPDGK